jgi:hypothetical protein
MMLMPISPISPIWPKVPAQPSLRIANGENQPPCPTNMPPPASTAVPLGERSVNVPAPAVPAARTLTPQEQRERTKSREKKRFINQRERRIMSAQPLLTTPPDIKPAAIVLTDDMKPAFRVGDYVLRVKGDTSPGHNRPAWSCYIVINSNG